MVDFEKIYSEYFRDVYRFAYSISRDEKMAEEITQETFFKALQGIDTFRGQCKLGVWLCQIAKNSYFSHLEKQKRFVSEHEEMTASEAGPEEALLKKDETLRVHKALHLMNDPYKEVFMLRVFGELSYAEIGGLFEKSEGWARVTFYRSKQKIQEMLREETRK